MNTNKNTKSHPSKIFGIAVICIVAALVCTFAISGTLARFISESSATSGDVPAAQFNFNRTYDPETKSFKEIEWKIDNLGKTHNDEYSEKSIYPGARGNFELDVSFISDVPATAKAKVELTDVKGAFLPSIKAVTDETTGESAPLRDLISLRFAFITKNADEAAPDESDINWAGDESVAVTTVSNVPAKLTEMLQNAIGANGHYTSADCGTQINKKIYVIWKWDYEIDDSSDSYDTLFGNYAAKFRTDETNPTESSIGLSISMTVTQDTLDGSPTFDDDPDTTDEELHSGIATTSNSIEVDPIDGKQAAAAPADESQSAGGWVKNPLNSASAGLNSGIIGKFADNTAGLEWIDISTNGHTFKDLAAQTKYIILIRDIPTESEPEPVPTEIPVYTRPETPKEPVREPAATTTTITLDAVEGAEYGIYKNGAYVWQDSNVFSDLEAGKQYKFAVRIKQKGDIPSSKKLIVNVSTAEAQKPVKQEAPTADEINSIIVPKIEALKKITSITVPQIPGYEFSRDSAADKVNWTSEQFVIPTSAGQTVTLYVRKAANESEFLLTSDYTEFTVTALEKGEQAGISDEELDQIVGKIAVSSDSIVAEVEGYEFAKNDGNNDFIDKLSITRDPSKPYYILVRKAATPEATASGSREILIKGEQTISSDEHSAVVAEATKGIAATTVDISYTGYQFSLDKSDIKDNLKFDTTPETALTIYFRKAETDTLNASAWDSFTATAPYQPGTAEIDGAAYWLLDSVKALAWFRDEVNSGKTAINGKLTADIKLNSDEDLANWEDWGTTDPANSWTPIGNNSNKFGGTFDGDGHTIAGIYINTTDNVQGLFGYASNAAIKNVGVVQSYINGNYNVGSIVGIAADGSKVLNCFNTGTISGSEQYVGGIVGRLLSDTKLINCYNTGTISAHHTAGGIAGIIGDNVTNIAIANCYNSGVISGTTSSANICGYSGNNSTVVIDHCRYISGSAKAGGDNTPTDCGTFEDTDSGKTALVAFLNEYAKLDESCSAWTRSAAANNGYPVFAESRDVLADYKARQLIDSAAVMADLEGKVSKTASTITIPAIGTYQYRLSTDDDSKYVSQLNLTDLNAETEYTIFVRKAGTSTLNPSSAVEYKVTTTAKGEQSAITADEAATILSKITVNSDSVVAEVQNYEFAKNGGNNNFASKLTVERDSVQPLYILVRKAGTTEISPSAAYKLLIKGEQSAITADEAATILSKITVNANSVVVEVQNYEFAKNDGNNSFVGKLTVERDSAQPLYILVRKAGTTEISPSAAYKLLIKGEQSAITADEAATILSKITVNANSVVAEVRNYEFAKDDGNNNFASKLTVERDSAQPLYILVRKAGTTEISPSEAYKLLIKGEQTISSDEHSAVVAKATKGIAATTVDISYTGYQFSLDKSDIKDNLRFDTTPETALTIYFRKAETDTINASAWDSFTATTPYQPGTAEIDGAAYYLLDSARALAWFRDEVNSGKTAINGKLTADIKLNSDEDLANWKNWGTTAPANSWTPIGRNDSTHTNLFRGTFDGGGHTIAGIYINTTVNAQGLFSCTSGGATIKNVGVVQSYIKGGSSVGGIVGSANSCTIINCFNTGIISRCSDNVGGIVGKLYGNTKLINCYNTGTISANYCVGGIAGIIVNDAINVTVANCYNVGAISGSNSANICGYSGDNNTSVIDHCRYISGSAKAGGDNTPTDCGTFEDTDSGKTALVAFLNEYAKLDENCSAWTRSAAANNGYPVFAESRDVLADYKARQLIDSTTVTADLEGKVSKTASTITIPAIGTYEYRLSTEDDSKYVSQLSLTGLNAETEYTIFVRKAETAELNPSSAVKYKVTTTAKGEQSAITADEAAAILGKITVNADSVVAEAQNYEFAKNDGNNSFVSKLTAERDSAQPLYILVRKAGTPELNPSETYKLTIKGEQTLDSAAAEVDLADNITVTATSINVAPFSNESYTYEYNKQNTSTDWSSGMLTISDLDNASPYTFYVRKKATDTHNASPVQAITRTTDKGTQSISEASVKADLDSLVSRNTSTMTVPEFSGSSYTYEYKEIAGTSWVASLSFSDLKDGDSKSFFARKKETDKLKASESVTVSYTISKAEQTIDQATVEADLESKISKVYPTIKVAAFSNDSYSYQYKTTTGTSWLSELTIDNVTVGTAKEIFVRKAETDTSKASASVTLTITPVKAEQSISDDEYSTVVAAAKAGIKATSVEISYTGYQFSRDKQAVCSTLKFDTAPEETLTIYFRKAATDTHNASEWSSFEATTPYQPGTAETDGATYYLLDSARALAWFRDEVNSGKTAINGKLTADIKLNSDEDLANWEDWGTTAPANSWTPIGNDRDSFGNNFKGIFDGDGHTIAGIYTNPYNTCQGLFGIVNDGATIKNVGVVQSYIKGGNHTGGIVGFHNIGTLTITNCFNSGTISSTGLNAGSLVGCNTGNLSVSNCYNTGAISANSSGAGGLVGYISNSTATLTDSYNTGTVSGSSSSAASGTGGLIGYINNSNFNITNCRNTGSISALEKVGGLIGLTDGGSSGNSRILSNSYNTGTVSGTAITGGLIGYILGYGVSITNCYNAGTVSGTSNVGAIIGYDDAFPKTLAATIITNCKYAAVDGLQMVGKTGTAQDYTGATVKNSGTFEDTADGKAALAVFLNELVKTNSDYKAWTIDSEQNNGYPIFAATRDVAFWDGTTASAAPSTETASDGKEYYLIGTAKELAWFASQVNSGNTAINGKLTADIKLNDTANWEKWGTTAPANSWTPIGNGSNMFSGTFDGAGHTIAGIYAKSSGNQALFGSAKNATIKNVGVIKSNIESTSGRAAAIVAYANSGITIENCFNTGNVSTKGDRAAGILADNPSGMDIRSVHYYVKNCYNTGTISSTGSHASGIVAWGAGTGITNCYNSGKISTTASFSASGIVGIIYWGFVKNCYNSGSVSAGSAGKAGGIAHDADNSTFDNCYNSGSLAGNVRGGIVASVSSSSNTISHCKYLYSEGLEAVGSNASSVTISDDTGSFENTAEGKAALLAFLNEYANTNEDYKAWIIISGKNNGYPIFTDVKAVANNIPAYEISDGKIVYKIGTADELRWFSSAVSAGANEISVKLTANIKLNSDEDLANWENWGTTAPANSWTPIGTIDYRFNGTFDGTGHTIAGIYTDGVSAAGLFAYADNATISNVGVVQSYIKCANYAGGIVGLVSVNGHLTLNNCYNSGTVRTTSATTSEAGGTVGHNGGHLSVIGCYNTGTVSSSSKYAGGLIGYTYFWVTSVKNCYNTGAVSASSLYAGGLIGYNNATLTVTNSHNTGTVSASTEYAGGLIGYDETIGTTIKNCCNTGNINCPQTVGGLVGVFSNPRNATITLANSYNVGTVSGKSSIGGLIGKTWVYGPNVVNCYNAGTVSGTSDTGAIIGYDVINLNSSATTITNCKYAAVDGLKMVGTTAAHNGGIYDGATVTNSGTFENTDAGKAALLTFLNANAKTNDDYKAWVIDPAQNNGYPIFTDVKAMASAPEYEISKNKVIYKIGTADELRWFSSAVNAGANKINGKLTADIKLNSDEDIANWENWGTTAPANSWTPISNATLISNAFNGTFDGDGHTVFGMYINSTETTEYRNLGLFGNTYKATIQNVGVAQSYVSAVKGSCGAIVGHIYGSSIKNCYSNAIVIGSAAGGICGYSLSEYGTGSVYISNCYNVGTVCGTSKAGGITGSSSAHVYGNTTYSNCYNAGSVSITDSAYASNLGSIIGYVSIDIGKYSSGTTLTIKNCYYQSNYSLYGSRRSDDGYGEPVVSDCTAFENTDSGKASLLTFLNANVTSSNGYKTWARDTTNTKNNGYPYFAN